MINGDINEFVDKLYYGEELLFEYAGKDYFLQGWIKDGEATLALDNLEQKPFEKYIWECTKPTMRECADTFLEALIWKGQIFMSVQNQITWKDW
jgi:hypothetical protein